MGPYIERPQYMAWLRRWEGKETVKVVSGVRRCGKSTLLRMFCDALVDEGVDPRRIISLNMEDIALDALSDYRALYDHIVQRLVPDCRNYVVIDEIQQVPHFEKVVNSLRLNPSCDIYITGSNAYLMASELATLLTGRYVELKMLPLSFAEFSSGSPVVGRGLSLEDTFGLYLSLGSFPYMMQLMDDAQTAREYLQDMFNSIMLKDVVQRLRIAEVSLLQRVARVLASSVGSLVSPTKIANTITSNGQKTDVKTVDKYIDGLTGSLLFYEASRWDVPWRGNRSSTSWIRACGACSRPRRLRSWGTCWRTSCTWSCSGEGFRFTSAWWKGEKSTSWLNAAGRFATSRFPRALWMRLRAS